jgi:hypothetical protein
MARITTTNQKKNTMIPGIAYPATVLAAMGTSYPAPRDLFRKGLLAGGRNGSHNGRTGQRLPAAYLTAAVIARVSAVTASPATRTVGVA